jgi:tetratricopeptide (TPR) repeat protein
MAVDLTTAPNGVPPFQAVVFISYSHDQQGKAFVEALIRWLGMLGVTVVCDRRLPADNPLSMPQWMEHMLANAIVICVLTPDYVRGFDHETADGTRRGTRFEIRILRQRLYDTDKLFNCPVIPVAAPDFPIADVPSVLRSLVVSRVDAATGVGVDKLVERIAALDGTGGDEAMSVPSAPVLGYRDLIYELEHTDHTTPAAIEAVHQMLALPDDRDHAVDLGEAFWRIEKAIKTAGDTRLMQEFSEKCLRMLRSFERRLACDFKLEARILICGKAWHLQREHKLDEALEGTRQGVDLARQYGDPRTEAFGLKCLGRLHRIAAEDGLEHGRQWNLDESERLLTEAIERFDAIDGDSHAGGEVGACHSLLARTELVRKRLLGDESALARALEAIKRADDLLPSTCGKDYWDAMILRAEIEFEYRHLTKARSLLGEVIERLHEKSDTADNSEILARAYVARAWAAENKTNAVRYYRKAADIFERLGLVYAAADANWGVVEVERHAGGSLRITAEDIRDLKSLTPDPRTRLAALEKAKKENTERIGNASLTWRADWRRLVRENWFQD